MSLLQGGITKRVASTREWMEKYLDTMTAAERRLFGNLPPYTFSRMEQLVLFLVEFRDQCDRELPQNHPMSAGR